MQILIVAGEDSGDQHAAGLIRRLKQMRPDEHLHWYGSGGSAMKAMGVELLADVSRLAAIGPGAALANLGSYWALFRRLLAEARHRRPALAILVDFPEFNLLLARRLKRMGIPVCYFISPQIWAWRRRRIRKVKKYVDLMLVIFPFEEEYYRRHGVRSNYVGNPLSWRREQRRREAPAAPPDPRLGDSALVGLMPGSRRKEIDLIFPCLLDASAYMKERHQLRFRVIAAPGIGLESLRSAYQAWRRESGFDLDLEFSGQNAPAALKDCDFALIKSGTSTLEAMLCGAPFAMVYRMSFLSWLFGRLLVRIDTYCLANIVAGRRIVEEFVQHGAEPERIGEHALKYLRDVESRRKMRIELLEAAGRLGHRDAYSEAAKHVSRIMSDDREAA